MASVRRRAALRLRIRCGRVSQPSLFITIGGSWLRAQRCSLLREQPRPIRQAKQTPVAGRFTNNCVRSDNHYGVIFGNVAVTVDQQNQRNCKPGRRGGTGRENSVIPMSSPPTFNTYSRVPLTCLLTIVQQTTGGTVKTAVSTRSSAAAAGCRHPKAHWRRQNEPKQASRPPMADS